MPKFKTLLEVENNLREVIKKYKAEDRLTIEKIKDWVFHSEGNNVMDASKKFHQKWLSIIDDIKDIDEINRVMQIFVDAWNYFPHNSLGGISPSQKAQEYIKNNPESLIERDKTAKIFNENIAIDKLISENFFFQDFLFFLHEAEKRPLELTLSGGLKIKEIYFFQENFKKDLFESFRNDDGTPMWGVRHEYEVPYLEKIRLIAEVTSLISKRKGKIFLNKNGENYLGKLDPFEEYAQMISRYANKSNWSYGRPSDIPEKIQSQSGYIWAFLNSHKEEWIDFRKFAEGLTEWFDLPKEKSFYEDDLYYHSRLDIEYSLMRDLEWLGLIELKRESQDKIRDHIEFFRSTILGKYVFENILL